MTLEKPNKSKVIAVAAEGLAFPKDKTVAKAIRRRVQDRKKRRSAFRWAVLQADGFACANLRCRSLARDMAQVLHAHHIVKRSQGGKDVVENGILLCPTCHRFAHDGYNKDKGRVTGRQFMIWVLKQKRVDNRWGKALATLEKKEPICE